MKTLITFLTLSILMISNAAAQFQARYATPFFDVPYSLDFVGSDGFVISSNYIDGIWQPILVRTDDKGNFIWANRYSLPAFTTANGFMDVKTASWDDNILLSVGTAVGYYGPTIGKNDIFLMMVNDSSAGAILLAKQYGTTADDWGSQLISAIHPKFGSIFGIAGITVDLKTGQDVNMMVGDSKGNILKGFVYNIPLDQRVHSVAPTRDGGFILVGETELTRTCKPGATGIFMLKLNAHLTPEWIRAYGLIAFDGKDIDDKATSVQEDDEGNFVIAGTSVYHDNSNSKWYSFLLKTDKAGNRLWVKNYFIQNEPDSKVQFNSLAVHRGDGKEQEYVLAGSLLGSVSPFGKALMIDTKKDGVPIWAKIYPPNDQYSYNTKGIKIRFQDDLLALVGSAHETVYPSTQQDISLVVTDKQGHSAADCEKKVDSSWKGMKTCQSEINIININEMGWMNSYPGYTPISLEQRACEDDGPNARSCSVAQ